MLGRRISRAMRSCLIAACIGGTIVGCGSSNQSGAGGHVEPSAEGVERSEEAEQKKAEAAEIVKDRELLSTVEGKKREETAEANAKHKEAVAAAKAKKREQAAEKAVKKKEAEAAARIKKAEETAKANTKKTQTPKGRGQVKKTSPSVTPTPTISATTPQPQG